MDQISGASEMIGRAANGRKLIAVVYMDAVGYSRHVGLDDIGTIAHLQALRERVIDPAVDEHGGTVIQAAGDSLLIIFDSIDGAISCAIKVQQEVPLYDGTLSPNGRMGFRIGVNIGDVIASGTNLHGNGVNVAARLQSVCPEGGVCVSRVVRVHMRDIPGVTFDDFVFEITGTDFGDAPTVYPVLLKDQGARHLNDGLEWLGQWVQRV